MEITPIGIKVSTDFLFDINLYYCDYIFKSSNHLFSVGIDGFPTSCAPAHDTDSSLTYALIWRSRRGQNAPKWK